jgi:hypothetical protein
MRVPQEDGHVYCAIPQPAPMKLLEDALTKNVAGFAISAARKLKHRFEPTVAVQQVEAALGTAATANTIT